MFKIFNPTPLSCRNCIHSLKMVGGPLACTRPKAAPDAMIVGVNYERQYGLLMSILNGTCGARGRFYKEKG